MSLKDLVVNTDELQEKWIKEIIQPYVNYDIENRRVIVLPAAASLPSRKKVLIFLVALRGWPFLVDDEVPTGAKPAQIGEELGIQGGTLRPVLKDLKDSNLISVNGQSYSVSIPALPSVKEEVEGGASTAHNPRAATSAKKRRSTKSSGASSNKTSSTSSRNNKNTEFFDRQIAEGFFDEPKRLADVVERFHEKGLTVQKGSISPLLIKAVRTDRLQRKKSRVEGRDVWVYESVR